MIGVATKRNATASAIRRIATDRTSWRVGAHELSDERLRALRRSLG